MFILGHGRVSDLLYKLRLDNTIDGCIGGEVCKSQPVVSVLDSVGRRDYSFNGTALISLDKSLYGLDNLFVTEVSGCTFLDECGELVTGRNAKAYFINGQAQFEVG
jgi:hypothetical protein